MASGGNVLFKLLGQVFVDTDDAEKSMSKTTEKAESMADKLGKGAKTVGKIGAATVGAAAAISGVMINNAKSTASAADEIDKASIRMGIGAERYQELAYAAGQSGVEMSTLEKAAKKLEGTGINFDDAINSIMSLETAEERAAAASDLFGEAVAYQMSPLIEQSGESFNGLIDRANELGLVMSEDAVKGGVEFGDLMSDMENSVKALGTSLGSAMMPVLNELLKTLVDNMPMIQSMMQDLAPVFADLIAQILPPLVELIKTILPPLISLIKAIAPIITEVAKVVVNVVTKIIDVVGSSIGEIKDFWTDMVAFIEGVVEAIKKPINAIIGGINSMFSALSIDIPDWVPVIGGNTLALPQIPMLAKGGTITSSGSVIVGEQGPEVLNLPTGASVQPLQGGDMTDILIECTNKIISAMNDTTAHITVDDPYRIFKLVRQEEIKNKIITGAV